MMESRLSLAVTDMPEVRLHDDRDPDVIWAGDSEELGAYLEASLQNDPIWCHRPDISVAEARTWEVTKALLGIPKILRPLWQSPRWRDFAAVPHVFPNVKQKCFALDGRHFCSKVGHSCWRRIVDSSRSVGKHGWKVLARGVRGVLRWQR